MEDFRKAYEINSELAEVFKEVGIQGDFGLGGLNPSDWPEFGPVQKTLTEFKAAYDDISEGDDLHSWETGSEERDLQNS